MFNEKNRKFYHIIRLNIVMLVYALHLFSFLGLVAATGGNGFFTAQVHNTLPANKTNNHHDPSSAESRAMFKYEDAKQLPVIDHTPALIAQLQLLISPGTIVNLHNFRDTEFTTPSTSNKRYRLLQVFLI